MELNGPGEWDDGGGINCRSEDQGGEFKMITFLSPQEFRLFDLSSFQMRSVSSF